MHLPEIEYSPVYMGCSEYAKVSKDGDLCFDKVSCYIYSYIVLKENFICIFALSMIHSDPFHRCFNDLPFGFFSYSWLKDCEMTMTEVLQPPDLLMYPFLKKCVIISPNSGLNYPSITAFLEFENYVLRIS